MRFDGRTDLCAHRDQCGIYSRPLGVRLLRPFDSLAPRQPEEAKSGVIEMFH